MDKFSRYSYDPVQPDELRMCRFVEDNDHVCAVLKIFPASASYLRYTALSYTWGKHHPESDRQWNLKIGEKYLPALDSLRSFVQALRSKGTLLDGTWWWIDSICIDQANIHERGEHVRRMKDIYRRAHNTIVWLGEQSDDSDRALDFVCSLNKLSRAGHSDEEMRVLLQEEDQQLDWIALRNFFLRKWWTRVWTIQEFVIPSSVSFLCGIRNVSRTAVCAALWVADRCNTTGFKDSIAFHHAWNRRRAWLLQKIISKPEKGLGLTLLALVAYFCSNEATDDRDRLYGLAALAAENHGLEVNYHWHTDEVYLRFAQSFIEHHKCLDILSFASLFSTTAASSLPSWVPDWRTRLQPLVVPLMISQSSCSTVGNLRPPKTFEYAERSTRYSACGSTAAVFGFEGSVLVARGLVIDEIDSIAGSEIAQGVRSTERHAQPHEGARSPTETLESICRSLVLGRGDRYLRYPMPTVQFYNDFLNLCLLLITESPHVINKEFRDWFQSMASLCFNGQSFENVLRSVQDEKTAALAHLPPNQDEYIQDSFYGRFFDVSVRMSLRLMSSYKGRVGTVPAKATTGDLVCILYGCSVPMLLRKREDEERFTIVGECYLDGFMNGEALKQADASEVMFQII
ncbi:hypothetical protein yc1106_07661 [Curvularia clavata]|uniref:Heterokaryon incompatibility domain-containing protein n=1 Tax=Curvularia clavata TaxID=95742 RepID=A0A9Q8ZE88_CURCL|nr:hypothetical protein yc1106_07661 [Curvularia clavata]